MSACLSHPCLHGGTCVDTYFLHNNGIESLSMYSNPSFIDTEQNGMSYICKCMSPYAGHNCEGNQQTDKLQCLSSVILSCQVGRKQIGTISISKQSRHDGFKSLTLHTSDIFNKDKSFSCFWLADDSCRYCSAYAECILGHCVCKEGFHGDGKTCKSKCWC